MLSRIVDSSSDDPNASFEVLLLKLRYKEGRTFKVPSNKPLLLHDPNTVWLVYNGRIDVFYAPVEGGTVVGARKHLFRSETHTLLMGLATGDSRFGLVAVGTGETEVMSMPITRLRELAAMPEYGRAIADVLNNWIASLYSAIISSVPPKEFTLLEPGKKASLKLDAVARAPKGVVWVKPTDAELRYMGRKDLPALASGEPFPFTGGAWLNAGRFSKLETLDTPAILAGENGWEHVAAFHRFARAEIERRAEQAEAAERQRLANRARADIDKIGVALDQLAAPLREGKAAGLMDVDTRDPLLAACQIVGRQMGIEVRAHPDMLRGKALRNPLSDIAKASRFRTRQVALKGEWWKTDSGPMLGFWEEGRRPVALLPVRPGQYQVFDPVTRETQMVSPTVVDNLSYFAHQFYRPFPERPLTGWDLVRFGAKDIWGDLATVVLMGALAGILATATPIVTGVIFDRIIPDSDRGQLLQLGLILLMTFVAGAAFQVARSIAMLRVESRMDASIQAALWDRLINLPTPFFRRYSSGDLAARALGIELIRQAVSGPTITAILGGLFSVFNLAVLFAFSPSVGLVAVGLVLVAVIVTLGIGFLQIRIQRGISDIQGRISGLILQVVTGISKFRMSGSENRAFALWAREFGDQKQRAVRARGVRNYLVTFNAVFPILATMVIFAAVHGTQGENVSTGGFIAFYSAFTLFLVSALQLSLAVVSLFALVPTYERVRPILQAMPEVDSNKSDPSELTGEIEVSHVSFRYKEDSPLILRDVSLSIERGQFVALVGASGSGKSTLLRLLLGFELPESGAIFYDGQDLGGLDVRAVRRQLGVVLQSSQLMSGSIFENIVGQTGLTIDDAWVAAKMAGLDEDIRNMPMGMHTLVGEGGSTFSGGQRQRLLVARAIVTRPRVLFFDEATSALDNRTQEIVSRSLEQLDATRVVIAHRLSTIINADKIVVMDRGEIVQTGSYKELMAQKGLFADLAKRQLV